VYAERKNQVMGTLKYEEIGPVSHGEAETVFRNGDPSIIARTLISIGLHDHDWKWVQQKKEKGTA
jgi:hypothetical protein